MCFTVKWKQQPLARAPSLPSNPLKSHHPPPSLPLPNELAALHLHQPTSRGEPDLPLISFPPIFYTFNFYLPSASSFVHLLLFGESLFPNLLCNLFLLCFSPPPFHVPSVPWWPSFLSVITLCSETESRKRKELSWLLRAVGFKRLVPCCYVIRYPESYHLPTTLSLSPNQHLSDHSQVFLDQVHTHYFLVLFKPCWKTLF